MQLGPASARASSALRANHAVQRLRHRVTVGIRAAGRCMQCVWTSDLLRASLNGSLKLCICQCYGDASRNASWSRFVDPRPPAAASTSTCSPSNGVTISACATQKGCAIRCSTRILCHMVIGSVFVRGLWQPSRWRCILKVLVNCQKSFWSHPSPHRPRQIRPIWQLWPDSILVV